MTLNNSASMVALGNLNKNVKKVGTTLAKIASGDRIPTAKYDSAGLAMSEILREQLRSLHQDQQNVQNGSAMFKVASGGIDDIIQNIRRLKELAINAANDSNSDIDRATIQKEVDASLATIEDIAMGTEYNGRKLLDGSHTTIENNKDLFDTRSEPIGTPSIVTGSMTISSDGVYQLDESIGESTINVTASNVKIIGASSAKDVSIVMQNSASLWLENFNAATTSEQNLIDFQGEDNFLHILGTNSLSQSGSAREKATIRTGGNLTVSGEEKFGEKGTLSIDKATGSRGAAIGSNAHEAGIESNITILSGTVNVQHADMDGSGIGTGYYGSIGDITIWDGNININIKSYDPAIGSAIQSTCGLITINGGHINVIQDHSSYEAVGIYNNANLDGVKFAGGKIHIENSQGEYSVNPQYEPPGNYSNGYKIYDQDLPNVANYYEVDQFKIHHGTRSNQMNNFYIKSMRPRAMELEKLDVTTRDKAESAISKIESALEYALDVATDVGSYMERLEFTESNLEIKSENTALSDSVLRDADMAKEMTEYTKFNVLTQSAQAMLAQAGQNQSQVLSLLQ